MKRTDTIGRHGDILFLKTTKVLGKKSKTKTVALGEVTGHHHTFDGNVVCYAEDDEVKTVEVLEMSPITHQEHGAIELEPNSYKVFRKMEYDPFAQVIRRVID